MRPKVTQQIVREYVYAYIAVCPELGRLSALVLPEANTTMMNLFLNQVGQDFSDYFIIMQIDQAAWHLSKELNVPDNIQLLPQPPHSPELNPVERIWKDIREKEFANLAFPSINKVIDRLCIGINRLVNNKNYLSSLTSFPHMNITCCIAN